MLPSRFERYIATRYLWRSQGRAEGRRFVRFITYMAVGGVAIGVCALLLALAIVRGFSEEITRKIIGFGAHVQVIDVLDEGLVEVDQAALSLAQVPGVREVEPVVEAFALLRRSEREIDGVVLRGMRSLPAFFEGRLVSGVPSLSGAEGAGAVIGAQLARLLGLEVGDRVVAYSMRGARGSLQQGMLRPRAKQFVITGIYETSFANFDELYVFVGIDVARDLFGFSADEATRLDLMLDDPYQAGDVADRINEIREYPSHARTVFETYRQYFAWVRLQESMIPLVIGVIVLVGAFNIVGTLLMILLEKTPEVGVLGSMGASRRTLRRLFLYLGVLMGALGVAAGESLALILALLQKKYDLIPLPEEAYFMETAPISLQGWDFLVVALLALALCALAAYIPARVASRIEPIRAIRFR